jgi:hypothetical protein
VLGLASNAISSAALLKLAHGLTGLASLAELRLSGQQGFSALEDGLEQEIKGILSS